jgi:long-chain acyl-CoA synthetase
MLFCHGAQIGFFQGDVKKLVGDIQELKPTIFVSVPRLLNRIYDKVWKLGINPVLTLTLC